MCGIAGIVTLDPETGAGRDGELDRRLRAMDRRMLRRGPDGGGSWRSNNGQARFAFRRLAILDPRPRADQPMASRRAPCALVFNGEIYNWRELRRELSDRGVAFETQCDTEVLLEALVEWGLDALPRLNGMFALAFWDERRRRLWLARDRFGMKPLFYGTHDGALHFGSQLDQLLAAGFDAAVDPHGLASYLGYGYVASPGTLLRHIRSLEPGTFLELDGDAALPAEPRRFVAPAFASPPEDPFTESATLERELAETLDRSVARHLVADVPRGVFLSSGVDSSLVALTAQAQERRLFTCTAVGERDTVADESGDVADFAARHGFRTHMVPIRSADAERLWQDFVRAYPDPHANMSSFARLELARRAKEEATVMLSGDGGDELFWGYSRMWRQGELARWHRRPKVVGWAARGVRKLSRGRRLASASTLGYGSLSRHYSELLRFYMKSPDIARLCPALGEIVGETDLYGGNEEAFLRDPFDTSRQMEARYHLEYCLGVADRTTMHHGIECRIPLLDLELVSLAERTPMNLCLGVGRGKLPLRRRLAKLCESAASLPKRGFEVPPFSEWMEGPLRAHVDEALAEPLWPAGLWADDAGRRLRSTDPGSGVGRRARFAVAVLQAWKREFLD